MKCLFIDSSCVRLVFFKECTFTISFPVDQNIYIIGTVFVIIQSCLRLRGQVLSPPLQSTGAMAALASHHLKLDMSEYLYVVIG